MGRVDGPSASPHHQEIHQNPAAGDAPPSHDEDLYEPPAEYQPPPPHAVPPKHNGGYDKPPTDFPPAHDFVKPSPSKPTATAFPPPQDHTAQPFPPTQPPQNLNFQPQQINPPPQGIPMGFAPSPHIPQHNLLQINQPWSTHLFDCMANPQNAIVTLFFPCVTFGQIAEILDNGGTSCASSGIVYSFVACCLGMPCLMSCGYRSKLRAKFGLVESPAPDCLIHCFCECCALCQEYRELEKRGFDPSIGHAGNVARHNQQKLHQLGMTPPMQQRMMI